MTDVLKRPVEFKFPPPGQINFPELRAQIEWAREDYDWARGRITAKRDDLRWGQETWIKIEQNLDARNNASCQTFACLAGHTVLSNGARQPAYPVPESYLEPIVMGTVIYDGKMHEVQTLATRMLGLDRATAEVFFSASTKIEDLEFLLSELETKGHLDDLSRCQCGCGQIALHQEVELELELVGRTPTN